MQTLDFNTLNTGDILITRSNQSWIQVHQLGLYEMAYVVQHVDAQNSAAVIARTGNESTQYILSVDGHERLTITPMVNADNARRVDEVFQMSAQEAQAMRLSARLKAERDLSHYLQSQYDNKTPNSVDKFIENFYKGSYMAGEYPTTFIMDMAKGRNLMNELIEGATDVYDAESEKENAVLDKVIAESRKAYDKVVATIKEAGIEYAYNDESVTLVQPDADYGSRAPRTLRIGTAIVDKETPYIISRILTLHNLNEVIENRPRKLGIIKFTHHASMKLGIRSGIVGSNGVNQTGAICTISSHELQGVGLITPFLQLVIISPFLLEEAVKLKGCGSGSCHPGHLSVSCCGK